MKRVFFFESMLTPKIITAVYWLLLASAALGGLRMMNNPIFGFTFRTFLAGCAAAAAGAIAARISCELLIVLFKMNESLQELRNRKDFD